MSKFNWNSAMFLIKFFQSARKKETAFFRKTALASSNSHFEAATTAGGSGAKGEGRVCAKMQAILPRNWMLQG